MVLLLDTTGQAAVWFALIDKGELVSERSFTTNRDLSEKLMPELTDFLSRKKVKLSQLKKIAVVTGPGQFSNVRTGVAAANALAFGLGVKVLGIRAEHKTDFVRIGRVPGEKMVLPYYDREPNISKPKKLKLQGIK